MYDFALLSKQQLEDAGVTIDLQVVDWATRGGAKALGLEDEIGSLETGKRADVCILGLDSSSQFPINSDPASIIVYGSSSGDVRSVMVDGKWVVRDKRLLTLDESAVQKRAQAAAERLFGALVSG